MNKKAVIAMSGGVDSSVAAYLMKEKGYECIGITIKTFNETGDGVKRENACCSLDDVSDARSVGTIRLASAISSITLLVSLRSMS